MAGVRTLQADEYAPDREYTLVVAIDDRDHVEQLMRTAVDLARARGGGVRVVSVVHKPATSPFLLFSTEQIRTEFVGRQRAALERAVAAAADAGVPVRRSLLVASDVAEAILSVVRAADAEALLLGWRDRPRPSDIVLGATVDPILRRAPCDVFVERVGTVAGTVDSILLPTDGGPNVAPAIDLAGAIARANDASVTALSIVPPDAGRQDRATARDHVDAAGERLADLSAPVAEEVRPAPDVADAIVAAAAEHDLVTLGATRERSLRSPLVGSVAARVVRRVDCPVVIAKGQSGRSLLGRMIAGTVRS